MSSIHPNQSLNSNDILQLNGYRTQVTDLQQDLSNFFHSFEESMPGEVSYKFASDLLSAYQKDNAYLIPTLDSHSGLRCQLLHPSSQKWFEGEFYFSLGLRFSPSIPSQKKINFLEYDQNAIIKIGNEIFSPNQFLQIFKDSINVIRQTNHSISEEFWTLLSHACETLFQDSASDFALKAKILRPGDSWQDCLIDLSLAPRLYKRPDLSSSPFYLYEPHSKEPNSVFNPSLNGILKFDTYLIPVNGLQDKLICRLSYLEDITKRQQKWYESSKILNNAFVKQLHSRPQVFFNVVEDHEVPVPCRFLKFGTGQWSEKDVVDGDLQVELIPRFKPDSPISELEDLNSSEKSKPTISPGLLEVESILDDIRQTMNQDPQ